MKNSASYFSQDLLASAVVFLVALPLCMGIAIASGVPPGAGLVTGIIGGIIAGAFSGCPLQVSGPAAGMAVLVYQIVSQHGIKTLGYVVLIAGALQVAAGLLKFGRVFRSISPSVIYGMLAGIGILILGSQFHVMVDDVPRANGLLNLISIPQSMYKGLLPPDGTSHHIAAFIGVLTIAILILWAKFAPKNVKWVPAALIAVGVSTVIANVFSLPIKHVALKGGILESLTYLDFISMPSAVTGDVFLLAVSVAFVASAETLLSAAAVDQMHNGPRTNYDKELFAQGIGNTICGFLGVLPMTGVIVRSATNVAAGAKTRRSTIMHGVWLLVLVSALPWLLEMVPTASLAAVLVFTGFKLVNVDNVRRLVRYGGAPVVIYAATVIGIVTTDLLKGILIGLSLSILKVVYARTHFRIRVERHEREKRVDVYPQGAASFLRVPMLADRLANIPTGYETHVHFLELDYLDDACLEALSNWQRQREESGDVVVLEWDEALRLYRDKNPLGKFQKTDMAVAGGAAH